MQITSCNGYDASVNVTEHNSDSPVIKSCSVHACQRKYCTKGYCQPHYKKLCKYGDPLGGRSAPKLSEKKRAQLRKISARHRRKCPEKERARQVCARAIVKGILTKLSCQFDGCQSLEVQAHHHDYSKPLEVTWLCRKHHCEHHRRLRGPV